MGQYWPEQNQIELAVLDRGIWFTCSFGGKPEVLGSGVGSQRNQTCTFAQHVRQEGLRLIKKSGRNGRGRRVGQLRVWALCNKPNGAQDRVLHYCFRRREA